MLSNLNDDIKVGISDYKIARAPKQIMTVGLGSCIGTIIYDERNKIGGLSHIMLPDSSQFVGHSQIKIAKFADLALPAMVEELSKQTSTPMFRFKAKIVGGASMFSFSEDAALSVGQIQPIGGVNEKIEGYFQICKMRGLNGTIRCIDCLE